MAPHLGYGAPEGSIIEVAEHGFINSELFVKWLQHFIDFIKQLQIKKFFYYSTATLHIQKT